MCHSSNCLTAKDKPIVSQKVFLDFQKYPPSKLRNGTNGTYFNFSWNCSTASVIAPTNLASVVVLLYCCGWTLDIVWVFGQSYFHRCKKYVCCVHFLIMILIMIFIYDPDNDPDLQCQDRANRHLSASNQRLHGNHWLALHPVSEKTTLYFGSKWQLIFSSFCGNIRTVSQKTTYFGSKCQLIFSTFIGNVDIFPHCPHYEGLAAIFRPRVTFINRWWLFDLVLFTSSIIIQDHHLHCTYFSTSSEAVS